MTPPRRVRTTRQVAVAIGVNTTRALEVLHELRAARLAEQCPGGWRMTEYAERTYGPSLRDMDEAA